MRSIILMTVAFVLTGSSLRAESYPVPNPRHAGYSAYGSQRLANPDTQRRRPRVDRDFSPPLPSAAIGAGDDFVFTPPNAPPDVQLQIHQIIENAMRPDPAVEISGTSDDSGQSITAAYNPRTGRFNCGGQFAQSRDGAVSTQGNAGLTFGKNQVGCSVSQDGRAITFDGNFSRELKTGHQLGVGYDSTNHFHMTLTQKDLPLIPSLNSPIGIDRSIEYRQGFGQSAQDGHTVFFNFNFFKRKKNQRDE